MRKPASPSNSNAVTSYKFSAYGKKSLGKGNNDDDDDDDEDDDDGDA